MQCNVCANEATHRIDKPTKLGSREQPDRILLCDKHTKRFNTWYYREMSKAAYRELPTDRIKNEYPREQTV